jgi:phosphoribosyl 1,2-cyclic phosphate phosphodiesterase
MAGAKTNILTILGSGSSTGVPILTCPCSVCRSKNPKNKRTRCSAWWQIQVQGKIKSLLIDTGPDFRQQALREKVSKVDAVLYTHPHNDHVMGADELRAYNFTQKGPIPIYGNDWLIQEMKQRFPYIFDGRTPEGGILPSLVPHVIDPKGEKITIEGILVQPVSLAHGTRETVGYRIDSVAYVSDCSYIPNSSLEKLRDLETLVLDCVRIKPHGTHLHLDKSLEIISELKPGKTFLTHLGHDFDYTKWTNKLPRGVKLAYDGLKIRV